MNFVMSVRPPVRLEQVGSHLTDFLEIWYQYSSKICRGFIKFGQE